MKNYYFTFMRKQAFKDHYVKIIAEDKSLARQSMSDHFGDKWAFYYEQAVFKEMIEKYNLKKLATIKAIDHGSSVEYILED